MNLLDYALIAVLAISVITAAVKGFAYEVLMMAATLAGIAVAALEYDTLAPRLHWISSEPARNFLAFVFILCAILVLASLLGRMLRGMVHAAGLGWFDRGLGAVLGLVRGVVLGAVLVLMLTAFPFNPRLVRNSRLGGEFLWGSRALAMVMPHEISVRFDRGLSQVD